MDKFNQEKIFNSIVSNTNNYSDYNNVSDRIKNISVSQVNDLKNNKEKELQKKINEARKNKNKNLYYENIPKEKRDITFKELSKETQNINVLKLVYQKAKNIDNLDKGMYLYGNTGVGKTTTMIAMLNYLYNAKSKSFYFGSEETTVSNIANAYKTDVSESDYIKSIASRDIICIDELGQNTKDYPLRKLKALIDEIENRDGLLFITSNYNMMELAKRWSKENDSKTAIQLIDRISSLTNFIEMKGKSLRR